MFVMGMLAGGALVALLVFLMAVAAAVRFGTSVRCDTCGVHSPTTPLVTERTPQGFRVKRPSPPAGWRRMPNGDDQCAACANAQMMRSIGHAAPATPDGAA